jgi:Sigma-70, region 4
LDSEDVVQDALFEAYRKLDQCDDSRPLAHRGFFALRTIGASISCGDVESGVEAEAASMGPDYVLPANPPVLGVGRAVEQLVMNLPPKKRACVLLKDVFDYTLEEIAELVSSTEFIPDRPMKRKGEGQHGRSKGRPCPPISDQTSLPRIELSSRLLRERRQRTRR